MTVNLYSSVSGGLQNTANGLNASVSGGENLEVVPGGTGDWTAGGSLTAIDGEVTTLQTGLGAAQVDIVALQSEPVFALSGFVSDLAAFITVDEVRTDLNGDGVIDDPSEFLPRILFEGVNVQVVNGDGSTNTVNGLGNLIVGYNEARNLGFVVCSNGAIDNNLVH